MDKYVLIISRGMPSQSNHRLGIFEFDQAKAISSLGINVIYLALDLRSIRHKRRYGFYKKYEENILVYTMSIPLGRLPYYLFYILGGVFFKIALNQILKNYDVDIIHSHFYEIGVIVSKIKLPPNIKWVHTEHSSAVNQEILPKYIKKNICFYQRVDCLITVSQSLKNNVLNNANKESICIPNIIDLECFCYSKKVKHDEFIFVSTGNLVKIKRMDFLIRIFAKTFEHDSNVKLIIIGEGTEEKRLKDLIISLKQEKKIELLGPKTRNEISSIYQQCDFFILLSNSETFGVAYVEALATGLPVIATKCGGPEDFVNEDNGFLVEKNNESAIINILKKAVNDNTFNYEMIAKQTKEKFSSLTIANQISNVYYEIRKQ